MSCFPAPHQLMASLIDTTATTVYSNQLQAGKLEAEMTRPGPPASGEAAPAGLQGPGPGGGCY